MAEDDDEISIDVSKITKFFKKKKDVPEEKPAETQPKPVFNPVKIIPDNCIGCGICVKKCPKEAIELINKKAIVTQENCVQCELCIKACPKEAIKRELK